MSEGHKHQVTVPDRLHEALGAAAEDLGVPTAVYERRLFELGLTVHGLLRDAVEVDPVADLYVCTKDPEGNLVQQHVVSSALY